MDVTQRLSAFALPHNTHPYVLLHCEITKHDDNVNEPNLERRMITLVGELVIFSKLRFYSCPDPLDFGFLSFLNDSAKSKGSGHE